MVTTTSTTNIQDFVNVTRAAELLGVTATAVRSLASRGHLPGSLPPAASPSGQWLIPLAAVTDRQRKKRRKLLPVGGFPEHKSNRDKDLRKDGKKSRKSPA